MFHIPRRCCGSNGMFQRTIPSVSRGTKKNKVLKGEFHPSVLLFYFPRIKPMLIDYTTTRTDIESSPPSRVPLTLAINIPLLVIAVLVVTLRLIVKGRLKKLAIEDALIVPPTVWIPPSLFVLERMY